jgi:hypothetical protein
MPLKRGLFLPNLKENSANFTQDFVPLEIFIQIFLDSKTSVCPFKIYYLNSTFLHCLNLLFLLI